MEKPWSLDWVGGTDKWKSSGETAMNDDKYAMLREYEASVEAWVDREAPTPIHWPQTRTYIINRVVAILADLDAVTRERDDARNLYDNLCVTVDALRAENAKLREALEPFAKMGDTRFAGSVWEDKPDVPIIFHSATEVGVTPSDFYLARTTLGEK
jgi:hypothetical protein